MNDDEYLDITPPVHYLQSIRADRGSWSVLVAEGIDNAFDADATEVNITLQRDAVTIGDNGCGITKDRESAIVRLGDHAPMPGTKLGRFGIGIKYNACSAGDLLTVNSMSIDGQMFLTANWPAIIRSGRWRTPRSKWSPVLVPRVHGTLIQISRLVWDPPTEKDISTVRTFLAQTFYPAIENGASIRVNGVAIPSLREPQLTDVVDQFIQLPNGKGAHVRGGILIDPTAPVYQVQVTYKHRVVEAKSTFGCESYGGTRSMFARVTLTADWGLSRFKNALVDANANELEDGVLEILRPILEKCQARQLDLKVDEITDQLNELLPLELQAARPPKKGMRPSKLRENRGPTSQHGRTDGDPSPTGPARKPMNPDHRIRINIDGPLCDEYGYGKFQKGRPNRITLARDNPDIAANLALRDTPMAVRNLYAIALMLYQHALAMDPEPWLPFDEESPFGLLVWKMAAQQTPAAQMPGTAMR